MTLIGRAIRALCRAVQLRRDPIAFARKLGVRVGDSCRLLGMTAATFGSEPYLVRLGNHVTVTAGVRFITHDGGVWIFREELPDVDLFGPICVEDNVFVGLGALLLPGVTIGQGSIVAAGAIVTRSVPPHSVVAGVPARVICSTEEYRRKNEHRFMHVRAWDAKAREAHLKRTFGING